MVSTAMYPRRRELTSYVPIWRQCTRPRRRSFLQRSPRTCRTSESPSPPAQTPPRSSSLPVSCAHHNNCKPRYREPTNSPKHQTFTRGSGRERPRSGSAAAAKADEDGEESETALQAGTDGEALGCRLQAPPEPPELPIPGSRRRRGRWAVVTAGEGLLKRCGAVAVRCTLRILRQVGRHDLGPPERGRPRIPRHHSREAAAV